MTPWIAKRIITLGSKWFLTELPPAHATPLLSQGNLITCKSSAEKLAKRLRSSQQLTLIVKRWAPIVATKQTEKSNSYSFRIITLYVALIVSIFLLNLYFAWTSHTIDGYPGIKTEVVKFARYQMQLFGVSSYFIAYGTSFCLQQGTSCSLIVATHSFIDVECISLICVVFVSTFLLFYRKGFAKRSIIRALQIGSLSVTPLGIEIYIFDRSEFFIHASFITERDLSWFSNADLLLLSIFVFVAATVLNRFPMTSVLKRLSFQRHWKSEQKSSF